MASDIRIILVRPSHGGNVGAAARALKNMGLAELWIVEGQALDLQAAQRMAHGAEDLLERSHRCPTLLDALRDCRWVVGTTRRSGKRRDAVQTPRTFAAAVHHERDRRPIAVVFGPEKDGLSADEIALCQEILWIPTSEEHPSLNLAQAVLLVVYELYLAGAAEPQPTRPEGEASRPATAEEMEGLFRHLEEVLLEVGFVRSETAPHQILALRRLLGRARMQPAEVTQLRGICRQILWAVRDRGR